MHSLLISPSWGDGGPGGSWNRHWTERERVSPSPSLRFIWMQHTCVKQSNTETQCKLINALCMRLCSLFSVFLPPQSFRCAACQEKLSLISMWSCVFCFMSVLSCCREPKTFFFFFFARWRLSTARPPFSSRADFNQRYLKTYVQVFYLGIV